VQVPGIGRKGAERLILELRDKIGAVPLVSDGIAPARGTRHAWQDQVRQALIGLGWSATQAEASVAGVADQVDLEVAAGGAVPTVPAMLKLAIRLAGSAGSASEGRGR
jgi:Holliday junction DNA helicase RuvA